MSSHSHVTNKLTIDNDISIFLYDPARTNNGIMTCVHSGPYVEINMRSGEIDGYDAVFISPHKFIGGPGSPGILLMSKKLYQLTSSPPSTCGGGTVSYVNGFSNEVTLPTYINMSINF